MVVSFQSFQELDFFRREVRSSEIDVIDGVMDELCIDAHVPLNCDSCDGQTFAMSDVKSQIPLLVERV